MGALVTPQEVRDYTAFAVVKNRTDEQLEFDILQAENEIFNYCGHNFSDPGYDPIPAKVKLAAIKLTEYYALINSDAARLKGYKSESIGDYSYTVAGSDEVQRISLGSLLSEHVNPGKGKAGILFRMRSV